MTTSAEVSAAQSAVYHLRAALKLLDTTPEMAAAAARLASLVDEVEECVSNRILGTGPTEG
ncbi:hypothetical protein GCM10022281_11320 [Sphingomonas rosea]|uniref:Uncharacterized protein n=2 Tax=Sphingomonas rosea TaxID=335605 RepID=A0ABP7TYS4_9SPHN